MTIRRLFKIDAIILLVFLCVVAWGITVWYQRHESEAREADANRVRNLANMSEAESALSRIKKSWLADDAWEDELPALKTLELPYSIEVEHALVDGHPHIFFGAVEDIHSADEQGNSLVSIKVRGRKHKMRLRLSLKSSGATTAYLMNNQSSRPSSLDFFSKMAIIAATIDSVEKIVSSDNNGDDQSYFVAHGTLNEAYVTQVFADEFLR